METTKLYRPVNKAELDLIQKSEWKSFPPRLPDQPIFYPVTNQAYASQITTEWNLPSYKNGFVTEFELSNEYLSKFKIEKVGLDHHTELWVPAEDLEEFNSEIIGGIKVVEAYHQDPKKEYIFVEFFLTDRKKEIGIGFMFINPNSEFDMNSKKSINGCKLKSFISHARTDESFHSIFWIVRISKLDFEANPFTVQTVQEFDFE